MYPETILFGTYNWGHNYIIEYDAELALAGLSAYYIHRARYKGDKMKNQRTVSQLPIPEPRVILGGEHSTDNWGEFFADVVIVKTFEEALAFLPRIAGLHTPKGSVVGMFDQFKKERKKIEADAQIAHEDEKQQAMIDSKADSQLRLF